MPEILKSVPPCKLTPPSPSLSCKADVGFILDASGSLKKHFQTAKSFLYEIASGLDIKSNNVRVGVVSFSDYAQHDIKFNAFSDFKLFKAALDGIQLIDSITRIDEALRLAKGEMFKTSNGARHGVRKVLIVLSDGYQTMNQKDSIHPKIPADELRSVRVQIWAVGVGRQEQVNRPMLVDIAGAEDRVYTAKTFKELLKSSVLADLRKATCSGVVSPILLPFAVSVIKGDSELHGVALFTRDTSRNCMRMKVTLSRLLNIPHTVALHEYGDERRGCSSLGNRYHRRSVDNILPDANGNYANEVCMGNLNLQIMGRSVVVTKKVRGVEYRSACGVIGYVNN